MKATEASRKQANRRYSYTKVKDARKHAIRGLWRRNGNFVARITVEDDAGKKAIRWVPLEAETVAAAQEAMRVLLVERSENRLRHIGQSPKLADYLQTYGAQLDTSGKRPATITKERGALAAWAGALGHWRLDQLRPHHVTGFITGLRKGNAGKKKEGLSGRTANLYLIALRNCLAAARRDGFLKTLPTENLPWQKFDTVKRDLFSPAEIDIICDKALSASKNGRQLADYLRLLTFSGARRNEALRLRWSDVDFERRQLAIGSDGTSKNRKPRHVDFSADLEAHLRDMYGRCDETSSWIFPSPQRGEKDIPAKSFTESLKLLRKTLPENLQRFAFHDCRHFFISFGVMAGIDFMTIARWVGHVDGGVLIGKVYGHLSNEHAQQQAARLSFRPQNVQIPQSAAQ